MCFIHYILVAASYFLAKAIKLTVSYKGDISAKLEQWYRELIFITGTACLSLR